MAPNIKYRIRNLKEYSFEKSPFSGFELPSEEIKPNILHIKKLKENLRGKTNSIHSKLGRIFSCNDRNTPEFSKVELSILKYEIDLCNFLGINQLNFHMKETQITKEEKKEFTKIIDYAKKNKVKMIYENHVCSGKVILNILETFPEVNFCLDFGHLNLAIKKNKFEMDLDEFIKKIKKRIVNIHIHNNYGEKDNHNSIDKGNFPWKKTLEKLKDSNLRNIIIESKEDDKGILKNKRLLDNFYK